MSEEIYPVKRLAIVSPPGEKIGKCVSIYAIDLAEAQRQLETEYGKGNVFNLHNPEDADQPRESYP